MAIPAWKEPSKSDLYCSPWFGFFSLWAGFTPRSLCARHGDREILQETQHLEGGIVSDIHVQNGDFVESGQPLLVLDATQPRASLEMANSEYIALKTMEAADRRTGRTGRG